MERGELGSAGDAEMLRHCWRAFADAFWLRISREHLRHWVRGPAFLLTAAAVTLALTTILSRGFSVTRSISQPLPFKDPGALVNLRYSGVVGDPAGVPPRLVPLWRAKSKYLADLAGFRLTSEASHAWVTTNFFSLMGTHAAVGRTFRPGDKDVAVLSGRTWRTTFGSDPRVIGSTIPLDGKPYTIVGVLPDAFWAISGNIAVWAPLILEPEPGPDIPFLIGAIGRLKPGTSVPVFRSELVEIAKGLNYNLPRGPNVTPFGAIPERKIFAYAIGTGFALAIGIVLIAIGGAGLHRHGWRYWAFLVLKTASVVTILPLIWIELSAAVYSALPESGFRAILTGLVFTLIFIAGFGWAVWWCFADQRRRCPVCLQLLAMPVTMGSWASTFEPAATELLCEEGHGTLCFPETEGGEPEHWTTLDDSWRDLFENKR